MRSPAAWMIATLFATLLIEFKRANKQGKNDNNLTLDQWDQLMQTLTSMPMMMSTMCITHHTQSLYNAP